MNWKRFTAVLGISILTFPLAKWVYSCAGGEDPYDYYTSFFLDDVNRDIAYLPFHYTSYLKYYDDWWDHTDSSYTTAPDANAKEWRSYVGNSVSIADIDSFVYRYAYKDLSNLYYHLESAKPLSIPADMKQNSMTRWFMQQKDLEALGYLMYAKSCEPHVAASKDYWEPPQRDSLKMVKLGNNGMQLYNAAQKEFFKWRYAYQILRLAYYSGQNAKTLELFNTLVGDQTYNGIMYARCMGLKAGALYRTGRKAEAAYLYSRVFDLTDEGKRSAHISYDWAVGASTADVLKLCRNDHERAVVYVMDGLYQYGSEDDVSAVLQKAYAADPGVKGLDVIMTRAINMLEQNYLAKSLWYDRNAYPDFYSSTDGKSPYQQKQAEEWREIKAAYGPEIKALYDFAIRAAAENKNSTPAYWQLSAAYLAFLDNNPQACKAALDAALKAGPDDRQRDLHSIITALYTVRKGGIITASTESDVLPTLQWLQQRKDGDRRLDKAYRNMLEALMASAYLRQQDTTKAILSMAKLKSNSGLYSVVDYGNGYSETYYEDFTDEPGYLLQNISMGQLHMVQGFLTSSNKATPFERWLMSDNMYTASVAYEMEGTRHIRNHDWAAAVGAFYKAKPKDLEYRLLPDPFILHIKDYQDWDRHDSAHTYTKLAFADEMQRLEKALARNPGDAAMQMKYALGLYSMTYYGRASHAFTYYRGGSDQFGYYLAEQPVSMSKAYEEYYRAKTAEQAFVKAAAAAKDNNLKAQALYMAAMCWQKSCPAPEGSRYQWYWEKGKDHPYYINALKNPYFIQLSAYEQTPFFDAAVSGCSYLYDYIRQRK